MASASKHHYTMGVSAIKAALVEELVRNNFPGATVTTQSGPTGPDVPSTIFTVVAKGRTEKETFTYGDIKDSANGTMAEYALLKVRDLVGRFET